MKQQMKVPHFMTFLNAGIDGEEIAAPESDNNTVLTNPSESATAWEFFPI
jgi:hypothetical protein